MRREQMKLLTRERVLNAARELFARKGYSRSTIREIAEAAGVSVGSVFTTFDSKEEILCEIVLERYGALAAALEAARTREPNAPARARLKAAMAAAYACEFPHLSQIVEQHGASWTWSHAFDERSRDRLAKPFAFIVELIEEAAQSGEIRAELDRGMLCDVLLGVYVRNFRRAWYQDASLEETIAYAAGQVDLLFDGAAPGR